MGQKIIIEKICTKRPCSEFPSQLPAPDEAQIYRCLATRYVRVGANVCDQFKRIGGCTGAPALWYKCGDVRPDIQPCPPRPPHALITRLGLVCIRNRPDPNLVCSKADSGYATPQQACGDI